MNKSKYGYNLFSIIIMVATAVFMGVGAWAAMSLSAIVPAGTQPLLALFVILPAIGAFKFLLREPPMYKKSNTR